MATDICSDVSSFSFSPRISFSHDLNHTDQHDQRRYSADQHSDRRSISDGFNFCVIRNDNNFSFEFSSADELFSDGKILPIQIKPHRRRQNPDLLQKNDNVAVTKKVQLRELLYDSDSDDDDKEQNDDDNNNNNNKAKSSQSDTTSFWKFRRSSSLNLEKIKSLHFISRSNSTGSTQPSKNKRPSLKKHRSLDSNSSSSSSSSSCRGYNNNSHGYRRSSSFSSHYSHSNNSSNSDVNSWSKSFPRKNNNCNGGGGGGPPYQGHYGNYNRIRVNPVLNLPQPCISKVTIASFFGFGSLFCKAKVRKKK